MAITWSYFCVFHKTLKYEILIDHFEIYLKLLIYHCSEKSTRVSASVHAGMPCPQDQGDPPRPGKPPGIRETPPGTRETPPTQDQGDPPGPGRHPPTPPHPGPGRHPPQPHTRDQGDTPHTPSPGPGRHPPTPGTRQTPPPGSRLQHTVYERPVRILLECILVQRSSSTTYHFNIIT